MREQPHWDSVLTENFFLVYYDKGRMSYPELAEMLQKQGHNIAIGTIYKYAKRLGFGRTISEGKRNCELNFLDYNISFLNENVVEAIDGFLLGDGCIKPSKTNSIPNARLTCGVEYELFCKYMMSFFCSYNPVSAKYVSANMSQGFIWSGQTKFHPDLYAQYLRWYPINPNGKHEKQPPNDVRITPKSVMIWYLGDGSLVQETNSVMLRLSTDSFTPEKVEYLASKLVEKGIQCHRNNDNRIQIKAVSIPAFFDFIGRKSPIPVFDYKFNLPSWRFEAKRMRQVASEIGIDYQRLAYLVKIGKIPCYRASENGRPRFLPEHIKIAKEVLA